MISRIKWIMRKILVVTFCFCLLQNCFSQLRWKNVDSLYRPLPSSVHVYFTDQPIDTGAFRAYYLIADLKDKKLQFTDDTTLDRRLTPSKFYERNGNPLVVVNCTFFSFETNKNLNVVVRNGETVAFISSLFPMISFTLVTLIKKIPTRIANGSALFRTSTGA